MAMSWGSVIVLGFIAAIAALAVLGLVIYGLGWVALRVRYFGREIPEFEDAFIWGGMGFMLIVIIGALTWVASLLIMGVYNAGG